MYSECMPEMLKFRAHRLDYAWWNVLIAISQTERMPHIWHDTGSRYMGTSGAKCAVPFVIRTTLLRVIYMFPEFYQSEKTISRTLSLLYTWRKKKKRKDHPANDKNKYFRNATWNARGRERFAGSFHISPNNIVALLEKCTRILCK